MPAPDRARTALHDARTIAVVGLDSRIDRPAYQIATYLQQHGYRVIPVHRGRFPADIILGERAYTSLLDIPDPVDLVDVFVRSNETGPIIDDAIAIHAHCIWLQVGIANPTGLAIAEQAGLATAENRCTMVEHRTLA